MAERNATPGADMILTCVEPGCSRITRSRVQFDYTCWEHSGPAEFPALDAPCDPDLDCGTSCYRDGDSFVRDGTRPNAWGGGDEDVQYFCSCEHHEEAP